MTFVAIKKTLYDLFLWVDILFVSFFYCKIFAFIINQTIFVFHMCIIQSGRSLLTLELWVETNLRISQQCLSSSCMSASLNFSFGLMNELANICAHLTNGKDVSNGIFAIKGWRSVCHCLLSHAGKVNERCYHNPCLS